MKTKIIPFDLETAKKIQAGEIKGKIKQRHGEEVQVLCWDLVNKSKSILAVRHVFFDYDEYRGEHVDEYGADGLFYDRDDSMICNDLVLEVPDNEPQLKPFDRVLVRNRDFECWHPSLYATTDGLLYYTIDCKNWQQCVSYEGNQDLVGTTNRPKEN